MAVMCHSCGAPTHSGLHACPNRMVPFSRSNPCPDCGTIEGANVTHACPGPQEPLGVVIEPRPEVNDFALAMEHVLRDNDHKGGWGDEDIMVLFDHLMSEVHELETELQVGSSDTIQHEAVDVANIAMMIHDNIAKRKQSCKQCGCDGGCR